MEKPIRFEIWTADGQLGRQTAALLRLWAEETCLQLEAAVVVPPRTEDAPDGCAMVLVDSASLSPAVLADLQRLRAAHPACGILLLAGTERAAIDVYSCHPNALVPQPVTYGGLTAALERCFGCWQHGLRWLDLPLQHRRVRIPLYQLYYVEAAGRNSILYRAGGMLQVNCSLASMEKQLPHPPFLRCQKSFLVHLGAVRRLTGGELIMCNDRVITVARSQLRPLQEQLEDYRGQRGVEEETV